VSSFVPAAEDAFEDVTSRAPRPGPVPGWYPKVGRSVNRSRSDPRRAGGTAGDANPALRPGRITGVFHGVEAHHRSVAWPCRGAQGGPDIKCAGSAESGLAPPYSPGRLESIPTAERRGQRVGQADQPISSAIAFSWDSIRLRRCNCTWSGYRSRSWSRPVSRSRNNGKSAARGLV
jgi:hypothetical protein